MPKIQEELKLTLKLLKKEWAEDLEQYRKKSLSTSLEDKKKEGICWYPLALKKTKVGFGERLIVEVERHGDNRSHGFQSGKSVTLFSNAEGDPSSRVSGVVNMVRKNTMVITLTGKSWPEWLHNGKLGVDLLFDEASYREMEYALQGVIKAEKGRLGWLRDVLLGEKEVSVNPMPKYEDLNGLNASQNLAIRTMMEMEEVAIIHGPPGTGKTTTLVQAIHRVLEAHAQVLVCAPSNAAVDLLVEKLGDQGISTLRIGHPARVDDRILAQTLDAKMSQHSSYRDLKKLRKAAEQYRGLGKKHKRSFGPEERAQRKRLFEEATRIREEAESLASYILHDVFQQSQVVATTLVGANNPSLKGMHFPYVFIDEAGQGLEPATWIPIMKADKVVMAGDHCQLPPTIKSYEAGKAGLSETLFEKVILRQPRSSEMLTLQYRMPELIMNFSSSYFYRNALVAAPNTQRHYLNEGEPVVEYIDTAGSGYQEQVEVDTLSKLNKEEARFGLKVLESLLERTSLDLIRKNKWNVGLVSPYKAQVKVWRELIDEEEGFSLVRGLEDALSIDTVDGFQGQEREVMLISLVRSNDIGEIGFLSDIRRMNVALTRARRKLIVVGDSATLSQHPFYKAFLDYAEANGFYRSIYEYQEFA